MNTTKLLNTALRVMVEADQLDDEYDVACFAVKRLMGGQRREQLMQLVMHGPTWDGDVVSKMDRDYLLEWGLAVRVCVKGEQGFTAASYMGSNVHTSDKG